MKISDLEPVQQEVVRRLLNDEVLALRQHLLAMGGEARRYLFFVNAGGAVALLSFMGASSTVRDALVAWIALGAFFLGIVAVGVLHGLNWHKGYPALVRLATNVRETLGDVIAIEEFDRRQLAVKPKPIPGLVVAYMSFFFFLVGAVSAITGLVPAVHAAWSIFGPGHHFQM